MPVKILILGGGQVGSSVVENLCGDANDITVVDPDADLLKALQDRYDIQTIAGNAAHPSVLEAAGADTQVKAGREDHGLGLHETVGKRGVDAPLGPVPGPARTTRMVPSGRWWPFQLRSGQPLPPPDFRAFWQGASFW